MMNVERDLYFGLLALRARLIDADQLMDVCTEWTTCRDTPLADLVSQRGWIQPCDRASVDDLVAREFQRSEREIRPCPAVVIDGSATAAEASPRTIGAPEISGSLAEMTEHFALAPGASRDVHPQVREHYTLIRLHATGGIGR